MEVENTIDCSMLVRRTLDLPTSILSADTHWSLSGIRWRKLVTVKPINDTQVDCIFESQHRLPLIRTDEVSYDLAVPPTERLVDWYAKCRVTGWEGIATKQWMSMCQTLP